MAIENNNGLTQEEIQKSIYLNNKHKSLYKLLDISPNTIVDYSLLGKFGVLNYKDYRDLPAFCVGTSNNYQFNSAGQVLEEIKNDMESKSYDSTAIINKVKLNLLYAVRLPDSNKLKIVPANKITSFRIHNIHHIIPKLFDIRIKDFKLSAKIFGLYKSKETLLNKIIPADTYEIDYGLSNKLDSETYYFKIPYQKKGSDKTILIKFTPADVEIILPNLRGYNPPKDRTIKIGSKVTKKRDKNIELTVLKIQEVPNYITGKRGGESVVKVRNERGYEFSIYLKYLKLI